ncbi:hypothetical protein LTV02_35300 [Nocardia yamanashiensis]|uniref:TPR repeat region-containing protein n=1 Tax=Nocardia yamanashiensis TaxID=209247 RepID=UPI001E52D2C0|nr:hypothetical protein [Nocardia yamanashiensis]UGT41155.1 hypothetical protein LTV02_35300 [Nocardia yamanashiensis]
MPTRSQVKDWDKGLGKLSEWATEIETDTQGYETQLGSMVTGFRGTRWTGRAKDAAEHRFTEEEREGRNLSQEIRDVAAAVRAADVRLSNERRILLGRVDDAEGDTSTPIRLTVDDNWKIGTQIVGTVSDEDRAKFEERKTHHQGLIDLAYTSLTGALTEVATAITAATQEVRVRGDQIGNGIEAAPTDFSDAGKVGNEDGKAIQGAIRPDGTYDTDALDRIASHMPQSILSDKDLQTMAQGGDVSSLPAPLQDYYREFYKAAGKDGILAMSEYLKGQETAGNPLAAARRDTLANGLAVMSNEHVGTGRNADGTLRSPGGYQQLPQDLRDLVSTRIGGSDGNAGRYPNAAPLDSGRARFLLESQQFGDLIKQASPGYTPGIEFSRELTRQAATFAALDGSSLNPNVPGGNIPRGSLESTMRDYLEVSGRNHVATTQLLTGQSEPGWPPMESGYDPKRVIQPLLNYDWTDSGGKQAPQLFSWIGEDAVERPAAGGHPGVTLSESQLAGKAASGLVSLLTQDGPGKGDSGLFADLMDMPGVDKHSLGQVNPGLTQQLAGALIPYLDSMALAPEGMDRTHSFEMPDGAERDLSAVRLSTLFNSDPTAAGAWNGAIADRVNDYAGQYAALHGQPSNDRFALADAAGRLLGYQDQGARAEAFDRGLNIEEAEKQRVERIKLGVDIAGTVLSGGIGEKAWAGGTFVDVAAKMIADGVKEDDTSIPAPHQRIDNDDARAQNFYRMLQEMSRNSPGFFDAVPRNAAPMSPEWLEDGHLRDYGDIVGPGGTDRNARNTSAFTSTADGWLNGLDVKPGDFFQQTDIRRQSYFGFTSSRDDYSSRVLKGN